MSKLLRVVVLGVVSAALLACAPYNGAPMAGDPNGTVDTTHGAVGAQTSPH